MATTRDIITRALKRIRVIHADETPDSSDMSDGLDALNDMIHAWKSEGVDALFEDLALADTFRFFVPPKPTFTNGIGSGQSEGRLGEALNKLSYQGTWDASSNSPALASGSGTQGYVYKVTTAGSTTLNEVTSWVVGDYALFDGRRWIKAEATNSRAHEQGVIALLGVRLCDDYGRDPNVNLSEAADSAWAAIYADWMIPCRAQWDAALSRLPSQRYVDYYTFEDG